MVEEKNKGGRPKKYSKAEELQNSIDKYFKDCDKKEKPYTMSGLAYALNIDRKTLINYSKEGEFFHTIKKAKQKVEQQLEENALIGKGNSTFTIFNLKNNFEWKDNVEVKTNAIEDLTTLADMLGFNKSVDKKEDK